MKKWLLFGLVTLAAAAAYVTFFAQSRPEQALEIPVGNSESPPTVQDAALQKTEPRPLPDLNPLKHQAARAAAGETPVDSRPIEHLQQEMAVYEERIDSLITRLNQHLDSAEERAQAEAQLQALSGEYKALALSLAKRSLAEEGSEAGE